MTDQNGMTRQKKLPTVFEGRNFRIPAYQRGYSWEKKQRDELLEDIEAARKLNYPHYMGTIVAIDAGNEQGHLDIVDGQQRLTSLVTLIARIVATSKTLSDQEKQRLTNTYLHSEDLRHKFRSGQQKKLMEAVIEQTLKLDQPLQLRQDINLVDACKEFDAKIEAWDAVSETPDIVRTIEDSLGFILFVPRDRNVAGRMFEVINNRGKPLSELEKIKNFILYKADDIAREELKEKVESHWREILIGIQEAGWSTTDAENEFLRACWLVFGSPSQKKSFHVYRSLKENLPEDNLQAFLYLKSFIEFIATAAIALKTLFTTREEQGHPNRLHEIYEQISLQPNLKGILPLVLAIESNTGLKLEEKVGLLELLEKLNFRYYVVGIANRNDSHHGELFTLAYSFFKNKISIGELSRDLTEFIKLNASDKAMSAELRSAYNDYPDTRDFYHWHGLRYFLARFEASFVHKSKSKCLSRFMTKRTSAREGDHVEKEHIWAVNMGLEAPKTLPGFDDFNQRRLGNFTLLGRRANSKASSLMIEEKVQKFFADSEFASTRRLAKIYQRAAAQYTGKNTKKARAETYERFLRANEEEYVKFALSEWAVSEEASTEKAS